MVLQSFSVFVNNIPPIIHGRWLKQIFQHHGSVMEAFIPQKRSKSGRKYGFVRFPTWSEANNAVEKLNGAWLLDHQLDVDFARFNENSSYWRRADSTTNGVYQRRSNECPSANAAKNFNHRHYNKTDRSNNGDPTKSCCNQTVSDDEQDMIECPVQDLKWLEASVVASVRSPLEIQALQQRLIMEKYSPSSFHPMGGSWFLIRFERKEAVLKLLADKNSWLEEWFYWIKPWSKELISDERFAWIRLHRIPLQAWNEEVFKHIGNHVDKYILADQCSVNKLCLDYARILVVVSNRLSVSNTMEISVNKDKFSINLEIENNTEFRMNKPPFTVQGRNSNLPAFTIDSNPVDTVQAKISVQMETQILQDDNDQEPPLVSGEAVSSEKNSKQEYNEMMTVLNRDKEMGGNFELKHVDEILLVEVKMIKAKESTYLLDDPNSMAEKNTAADSEMPSEENRALCLVQYDETNTASTDDQVNQQSKNILEETIQVTGGDTKKSKRFISVSALQSVEDKSGEKNSISIKRKGAKNRKKSNFSRKKENKLLNYYSDTPSYIEEEITDDDIRNRNRMLRKKAQATLEMAKLLGLSPTANDEDIIRSLMEAEIEDMARNIYRDQ